MRAALSVADFCRQPVDAFVTGRGYVYARPHAHLCISAIFGIPTSADFLALARLYRTEIAPTSPPHTSMVDVSRLATIDPTAFTELAVYVRDNRRHLADKVEKLAIVRPGGMVGATVAGFFRVADAPHPVEVFETAPAALGWLGEPDHGILSALDGVVGSMTGSDHWLAAFRRALDAEPGTLHVRAAARMLALSPRSLQRRLARHRTTFQTEVRRAQVRVAQRLLDDSSASVAAIGHAVGCSTPQRFSFLFRTLTGMTPTEWRTRTHDATPSAI